MKQLTIFDLDETLIDGDTSVKWRQFLQDKGIITDPDYSKKDAEMMRLYAEGSLNLAEYIEFSVAPIEQIPKPDLQELVEECVKDRLLPHIFSDARQLIAKLQAKAPEDILVISATVAFIVEKIAENLGINESLGVNLVEKDGFFTTKILGTPSFQAGKVERLKDWLQENNRQNYYEKIVFYTDSINDLPLCEYSDQVFAVNPCKKLQPIAQKRGWNILNWQ